MITLDKLKKVLPQCKEPEEWVELLQKELVSEHGFTTKQHVAAFLAQTAHESSSYNTLSENLNYSGERLNIIFPKYFKNRDVSKFHRNPEAIANVVYANRMGNGDESSGEGYKFRGRGILQVTGKVNYMKCSEFLFGTDNTLVEDPDLLLLKEHALGSALWFWTANKLTSVSDFVLLTKKINGGTIGLEHRTELYNKALKEL